MEVFILILLLNFATFGAGYAFGIRDSFVNLRKAKDILLEAKLIHKDVSDMLKLSEELRAYRTSIGETDRGPASNPRVEAVP